MAKAARRRLIDLFSSRGSGRGGCLGGAPATLAMLSSASASLNVGERQLSLERVASGQLATLRRVPPVSLRQNDANFGQLSARGAQAAMTGKMWRFIGFHGREYQPLTREPEPNLVAPCSLAGVSAPAAGRYSWWGIASGAIDGLGGLRLRACAKALLIPANRCFDVTRELWRFR